MDPKALGRMSIEVKLGLPDHRLWVVEPSQFIENIDDDFIYVRSDPKLTGEACSLGVHWVVGEPWEEKAAPSTRHLLLERRDGHEL